MTDKAQRKGTRCPVCVMCGRCFEDDSANSVEGDGAKWTGTRCEVCVSCGKCAEAWGLTSKEGSDASSGPTNWGDAFKMMDTGSAGAPPPSVGAPGVVIEESSDKASASKSKPSSFACLKRGADGEEPDASTGATPGVSSSCKEHGLDDMHKLIADLGIKPPGQA